VIMCVRVYIRLRCRLMGGLTELRAMPISMLASDDWPKMPYMTDQGPLGRPPRGASVPGGAPRGAGPQLTNALNFDFDFAARYSVPIGAPEQPQYASTQVTPDSKS
jgi:hypothetical protein